MRWLIAIVGMLVVPGTAGALDAGDLLYVGSLGSGSQGLSVFSVDRITGDRTVVSGCADSGDPCSKIGAGPDIPKPDIESAGIGPVDLAYVSYSVGKIWVNVSQHNPTSSGGPSAALYSVDPVTGNRAFVSGCTNFTSVCNSGLTGSGPIAQRNYGLAAVMPWTVPDAIPHWLLALTLALIVGHASWMLRMRRSE